MTNVEARPRVDWTWCLVGWMAVRVLLGAPAPLDRPTVDRPDVVDLADVSVRELRSIEGVGDRRAVAIARALWDARASAEPLRLEDVAGVGPATARAVEAWWGAREGGSEGPKNPPGPDGRRAAPRTLVAPPRQAARSPRANAPRDATRRRAAGNRPCVPSRPKRRPWTRPTQLPAPSPRDSTSR